MSDTSPEREERIRARAYEMWESEGRQEGRAEHYWHRARLELEPPSGSLDDQLAETFPASDTPSILNPSYPEHPLPAAPEDEPLPARSATVEERPEPQPQPGPGPARPARKAPKAGAQLGTKPVSQPTVRSASPSTARPAGKKGSGPRGKA